MLSRQRKINCLAVFFLVERTIKIIAMADSVVFDMAGKGQSAPQLRGNGDTCYTEVMAGKIAQFMDVDHFV